MPIPPELNKRLFDVLKRCGPFKKHDVLCALFADARIAAWHDDVPEADTPADRVRLTIDFLINKADSNGQNGLVLFLHVLRDQTNPNDDCYLSLRDLADQIEKETTKPVFANDVSVIQKISDKTETSLSDQWRPLPQTPLKYTTIVVGICELIIFVIWLILEPGFEPLVSLIPALFTFVTVLLRNHQPGPNKYLDISMAALVVIGALVGVLFVLSAFPSRDLSLVSPSPTETLFVSATSTPTTTATSTLSSSSTLTQAPTATTTFTPIPTSTFTPIAMATESPTTISFSDEFDGITINSELWTVVHEGLEIKNGQLCADYKNEDFTYNSQKIKAKLRTEFSVLQVGAVVITGTTNGNLVLQTACNDGEEGGLELKFRADGIISGYYGNKDTDYTDTELSWEYPIQFGELYDVRLVQDENVVRVYINDVEQPESYPCNGMGKRLDLFADATASNRIKGCFLYIRTE